jgi:membrane protease YdiL (CAAX protease family)
MKLPSLLITKNTVTLSLAALIIRLVYVPLGFLIWKSLKFQGWYQWISLFLLYGIVSLVIWAHENELTIFNIDKPFMLFMIIAGVLLSAFYLPSLLGFIILGIALITTSTYKQKATKFEGLSLKALASAYWILLGFLPLVPFVILSFQKMSNDFNLTTLMNALYSANFPLVVIEEFIFRGALYWILQRKTSNPVIIILVSATTFWLSHLHHLATPVSFFIWTPMISIWLGLIVWRTKSLTLSSIFHFVFNLLIFLM